MRRRSVLWALAGAFAVGSFIPAQPTASADVDDLLAQAHVKAFAQHKAGNIEGCVQTLDKGLRDARALLDARPELQIVIDKGRARAAAADALTNLLLQVRLNLMAATRRPTDQQQRALNNASAAINRLRQASLTSKELVDAYEDLIALQVPYLGTRHGDLAGSLYELGATHIDRGEFHRARPLVRRAVAILEDIPDESNLPVCLDTLALVYQRHAQYQLAETTYKKSLKLRAQLKLPAWARSPTEQGLAQLYSELGRFPDAEDHFKRARDGYRATPAKDYAGLVRGHISCLNDHASMLFNVADFDRARELLAEARGLREKYCKNDAFLAEQCDVCQADLLRQQGSLGEAERMYLSLRQVYERRVQDGTGNPVALSICLQSLAAVYVQMDRYADAERLYEQCLKLRKATLGDDHPSVAAALDQLGLLRQLQKRYRDAEPLLRRSLEIREQKLPKNHVLIAISLNQLAQMNAQLGQMEQAERLYQRCLEIQRAALGKDSRDEALTLDNLGVLYYRMGRFDQAEMALRDGLRIREQRLRLAAVHSDLALSHNHLGLLLAARGQPVAAAKQFDDDRRIVRGYTTLILPQFTPTHQLQYLYNAQQERQLDAALSLGLAFPREAQVQRQVAEWLVNGKALAYQVLAESQQRARAVQDPETAKLVGDLQAVRKELTRVVLIGAADAHERYDALSRQEQDLAVRLRRQGGRLVGTEPWVTLDTVAQALPQDAAFIDIARFAPHDLKQLAAKPAPAHYVAWITRPSGPVVQVDLGEAQHVDELVQQLHRALDSKLVRQIEQLNGDGKPGAERLVKKQLGALAEKVLHPLLRHLGGARRWVLCPDGELWLVPWNALLMPDGSYAVRAHTIQLVTSGRDLVTPPERGPGQPGPPLVLADADFDHGAEGAALDRDAPQAGPSELAKGIRAQIERLPNTAEEAREALPWLAKYAGADAKLLLRREANKEAVLKAARPRVLMLSTHAVVLEKKERKQLIGGEDNPLLGCAVLLAGCKDPKAPEQGVLTGLEVVGLDLRGTDLVMLSACKTGLGDVQIGEGVAGLRQCFQLAGARAVVATLWPVPDDEGSVEQVKTFFQFLAKGKDQAEALAQMQRKRIETLEEEVGAAHPFYWAAYTVTGAVRR
jgi:CHAT domain-containing protein/Tfp pilus assembly protein PilF